MGAMLPIFLLGLVLGAITALACANVYYKYKKDTPSETKLHVQEAQIIALKYDIETLETENERLNAQLLKTKKPRKTTIKKKKEE